MNFSIFIRGSDNTPDGVHGVDSALTGNGYMVDLFAASQFSINDQPVWSSAVNGQESGGAPLASAAASSSAPANEQAPLQNYTVNEIGDNVKEGCWDQKGNLHRSFNVDDAAGTGYNGHILRVNVL